MLRPYVQVGAIDNSRHVKIRGLIDSCTAMLPLPSQEIASGDGRVAIGIANQTAFVDLRDPNSKLVNGLAVKSITKSSGMSVNCDMVMLLKGSPT